jgi:putative toxin-antitoxin system antitoxin component (TIGR02293 family)
LHGIDDFVRCIAHATPMQLIEMERSGGSAECIQHLSIHLRIPVMRVCEIVGAPKSTLQNRVAQGKPIAGIVGQTALGIAKLLSNAQAIVDDSTAAAAKNFDTAKWLGRWIELPQPGLAGRRPAELISTPTEREVVSRRLGSIQSGAYQ